jgi:hypothetical protein
MRTSGLFPCLLCVLLSSGCAHNIMISPTLTPTALTGTKHNSSVGVYFAPDILAYSESTSPSSTSGSAHTYNVAIGQSVTACLLKAVAVAYDPVVAVATPPGSGEFDRVIQFSMQNSNFDVNFQDGFLTTNAKSQYTVAIVIEAYEGKSLTLLGKSSVTGNAFGSKQSGPFGSDQAFAETVETGVQQVCDGVANLLISGFAEGTSQSRTAEGETAGARRESEVTKYELLRQLKGLLDQGALTQEEYEQEKRKVLDSKE